MDLKNALLPLIGVALGWALTELSSWFRWKREWRRKLNELRIESYAEWTAGMEANLVRYASQASAGRAEYNTPLCEKRLQIIEHDPIALNLIRDIHQSIPTFESEDYKELERLAHSDPEWEWPPFREKMNQLLDHVRRRLS